MRVAHPQLYFIRFSSITYYRSFYYSPTIIVLLFELYNNAIFLCYAAYLLLFPITFLTVVIFLNCKATPTGCSFYCYTRKDGNVQCHNEFERRYTRRSFDLELAFEEFYYSHPASSIRPIQNRPVVGFYVFRIVFVILRRFLFNVHLL